MGFAKFTMQNPRGEKPDPNFPDEIRMIMPEDPDMILDSKKWEDYAKLNHDPVINAYGNALTAFRNGEKLPMLTPGVYTTIRITGTPWEICVNPDVLVAVPESGFHTGYKEKWELSAYFTIVHLDDPVCRKIDQPNGEPIKVSRKIMGRKSFVGLVRHLCPRLRIYGERGGAEAITMTGFSENVDSLSVLFDGAAPCDWTFNNTDENEYAGTEKIRDFPNPLFMSHERGDDDVVFTIKRN